MAKLDQAAKDAGILCLNEVGLDPGIDHMSAMRVINKVKKKPAGKVTSFRSYCGGLPGPRGEHESVGYKFSWSSRAELSSRQRNCRKVS